MDGEPLLLGAGYAALERAYDEVGNVATEEYFDLNNAPVIIEKG